MKRWIHYAKPYWAFFLLGPLFMTVEVIGEVIMPKLLSVIINRANSGTLTIGTSWMIMGEMVATALLMMLGGVLGAYFSTRASVNFAADLRRDAYSKVQGFSFSSIDKFSTGSLVTRLTNDITQVQNFINMLLRMAIRAPGMMVAALIMAIRIKPSLSVVFLVSIPLLMVTIGVVIRVGFPRFKALQEKVDRLNSTVQENVTNVRVVKSFVREDTSIESFHTATGELKDAGMRAMRVMIFIQPIMTFFMNGTIIAVLLLGGKIVLNFEMEPGDLSAFITYVTQILFSMLMVTILLMISSRALASAKRISEVLDEETDISDRDSAHKGLDVTEGTIEFRDVCFRYYKNSEDLVLDHINLTIPGGATVGLIGSTGCGKSTLVAMIPRLYDCDSGSVLVDGVNVKDYSLVKLRDGIGMVLQNNTLFSGSIVENLRWGDENATDEEVKNAAACAQADGFISSFAEGYEKNIDQGGTNVSGGQKQRLCIARALLKKPKILILDDSTSAVDTATEAKIREAFRTGLAGSTKIIIAQRISSVMDADTIIVMNDGKITGVGTHEELLEGNREYREIYESQTRSKAPAAQVSGKEAE